MQRSEADPSKQHGSVAILCTKPCGKELSQRWLRKTNSMWKLSILVFLGLCGMYLCIAGVEHRIVHQNSGVHLSVISKAGMKKSCSKGIIDSANGLPVHYPQPVTFDREECKCTPVHYFVIFSMQRSGSGWFEALLNSHPNVNCHGEIFSVGSRRANMSAIKKSLDAVYNLDWFSSSSKNDCTAAVGIKWMLNQGVMEYKDEIAAYLKNKAVSVIFLFRRNILKRYVSILANNFDRYAKQLNGTHKSHVHSKEEANVLASFKPVVNLSSLITYLQRIEEVMNDAQLSFKGTRHMIIYYEDLVKNPQVLKIAQQFLGVKPKKLESRHVKIHSLPFSKRIENWIDLNDWLKGTKYESLLNIEDYR